MHLFTYGSLMFPPVWSAVVAGDYDSRAAVLHGFSRRAIRHETYPALIPAEAQRTVQGRVYLDIDAADLARLDRFEGAQYRRHTVQVISADGAVFTTQVYLFRETCHSLLERHDWDAAWFEREGMELFLARYGGFARRERDLK